MKAAYLAAAAAAVMEGVSAHRVHRHAHELFHAKRGLNESDICVPECTTIYTTITGSPIWVPTPGPSTTSTPSPSPSSSAAPTTTPAVVPTPIPQTCPTPGTYTFPATTLTLTETTTVCGASTTTVPSGTHTLGGVTTVVTTATTVVCPYATTKTNSGGVVTSVIETTTYVCPSAGTYTIGPITETVTATETVVVVPVVETYCPGTYTAPAVTTVVTTETVVYCPFTSSAVPTLATSTPTTAAPVEASPTETKAAATTSPAAGGAYSGGGKSIAYTPYTPDEGLCKSAEEVDADIAKIAQAGFGQVRTYSTDCDTLPNVGAACEKYGIKMVVGIFIGQAGCTNASPDVEEQISALKSWKKWDIVPLVVVANEALFQGHCTASELSALITHVKSELGGAGYTGAYTTTDTVGGWIQAGVSGAICDLIDIVAINAYPYFAGNVLPDVAGEFVAGQLEIVEKLCGKDGIVLEFGHPSQGKCFGDLCGSKDQQKEVIGSVIDKLGDKVTILGFTNDKWKAPGDCQCEQFWGCWDLFGGN